VISLTTIVRERPAVLAPKRRRRIHSDVWLGLAMLTPAMLVLALVMLYPAGVAIHSSFFRIDTVTRAAAFVGLTNYQTLLRDPNFWSTLQRTFMWVVGAMVTQTLAGLLVALVLDMQLRGRNVARGLVLFPYLVPAIVAVLIWRWILSDTVGVANYLLVDLSGLFATPIPWFDPSFAMASVILMSLWKYTPFWAVLILARLQIIPTDLYEAASIDGANAWDRFRYITLPWILPLVMVILILRSIWAFNEFDMVYLPVGGGPLFATTTMPVYIRHLAFEVLNMGAAAAVAVTMLLMLIVFTGVYFWVYRRAEDSLS
jgi:multiple sugar transport system permease protein